MRILFVYKGEGDNSRNSVIDAQAQSLIKEGADIVLFPLDTGGLSSYFKAYRLLKAYLRKNPVDLIHAHYSYSAFTAGLTGKKTICSLMGSDVFDQPKPILWLTRFFYHFIWKKTIIKSGGMQQVFPKALQIPNGVDFSVFKPMDREDACRYTGFDTDKKNIIFVAEHPESIVKNLSLAQNAVESMNRKDIAFHIVSGKEQSELANFYNSADLLLLTSRSEGSPNVVKEAMACNCPIVSTDVGDVKERVASTEGCFVTGSKVEEVALAIEKALAFGQRTHGREKIQHLKKEVVASDLIAIYRSLN